MKLFVWEGVLTSYSDGIIFALADTLEEAQQKVLEALNRDWKPKTPITLDDSCSVSVALREVTPDIYESPIGFYVFGGD